MVRFWYISRKGQARRLCPCCIAWLADKGRDRGGYLFGIRAMSKNLLAHEADHLVPGSELRDARTGPFNDAGDVPARYY
jgi:hypothetical protein